jgi:hypothetical protein
MKTLRGATSPVYGNVEGCDITQHIETLRGATSPVYGNVEGCNITHQYMEKLRGAISQV